MSTGDLGGVVEQTDGLVRYQVKEYEFDIAESINRIPFNHQIPLFRQLNIKVTRPAREEILKQYQMVKELPDGQDLGSCKGQFRRSIGLPCKHEIQRLLLQTNGAGVLEESDVYRHWHYKRNPLHDLRPVAQQIDVDDYKKMEPEEGHEDGVRASWGLLNNGIIEVDPTTYKIPAPRGRIFVGDPALNNENYEEEEEEDNEENENEKEDEEL